MATTTFDDKIILNKKASNRIKRDLNKSIDYSKLENEDYYKNEEEGLKLLKNFKIKD
jgi:hypothetical protein